MQITYAGQAGFIFETDDGVRIGSDLYLSDCCYRYFGFKRLLPYVFKADELDLDILISTHAHYDHFDPDSVPVIMSNRKTRFVCAYDVRAEAERLNLEQNRITYLKEGDTAEIKGAKIKAVACDHGKDTPDAIGVLLTLSGKKIYIAGDTAFREDYFANSELHNADLLIIPINGAFGNMDETEGVRAAEILNAKLTVPSHYWCFAEHGGNPDIFAKNAEGKFNYLLMRPGETFEI